MRKKFMIHRRTRVRNGKVYTSYVLDCGLINGKRKFIERSRRCDLDEERDRLRDQEKSIGMLAYSLDGAQKQDAATALATLQGVATLAESAEFFVAHAKAARQAPSSQTIFAEYVEAKKSANRRQRTIYGIQNQIGRFVASCPDKKITEITTRDIIAWLDNEGYEKSTRRSYRTLLHGFFAYAVAAGHCPSNPVIAIPRPTIDERVIQIFTAEQTSTLLRTCADKRPELLPYFSLGLFAGLRPENELRNLDWSNIDTTAQIIRVIPATAKRRRQRLVDMSDNLAEWLFPHVQSKGRIFFSRKSYRYVREQAGVTWAPDIMRHTYGSFHLAQHCNAAATSLQMGHLTTDVLFNHYRDLVTTEEAAQFWDIKPVEETNAIAFPAWKAS